MPQEGRLLLAITANVYGVLVSAAHFMFGQSDALCKLRLGNRAMSGSICGDKSKAFKARADGWASTKRCLGVLAFTPWYLPR